MSSFLTALGVSLLALPLLGAVAYVVYYLFSLPLRRQDWARSFLDLVETGVRAGHSPEHTLHGVAESGDRSLGRASRRVASLVGQGLRLDQALEKVPRLLPPQIAAAIKAGCEMGDLRRVLSVCRTQVNEGVAKVWTAHHYLVLLAFVVTPAWTFVFSVLAVFVFPKFQQMAQDMEVGQPPLMAALSAWSGPLVALQAGLLFVFYFAAFLYASDRLAAWLKKRVPPVGDWLAFRVPWRRMRMHRDFSALLGMLLDAGVPEARAITLAAEGTANRFFQRGAARAITELEQGAKLSEAVRHLDEAGEFRWRLANAAQAGRGFLQTLAGWHETLAAKAFQQEQTAAQLLTTGLVFVNGLFVALLAVSVFQWLIALVETGVSW